MTKRKPIIICVDDEKFILDTLHVQLQKRFGDRYDFEFAERAEEAIALVGELSDNGDTVAMIISDQRMPGMTGDQLLIELHKKHPLPIKILLTGQASLESAVNAINNADLYRYISKPWSQDDFLLTIEKGLQQYDLFTANQRQLEVFKKFVPEQFIEALGVQSLEQIRLGSHVDRKMCIFFSDIRGFTTLSEKMTPEENYQFLNQYLECVEPAILNNNGFIDKFLGDGVMALFYNITDGLKAALETQMAIMKFNESHKDSSFGPIKSGIGLHFGQLMLGIIGVEDRLQCTVISDAVNLASRVQDLGATIGTPILVTEEVINQVKQDGLDFQFRLVGRTHVKGKTEVVTVFEILDRRNYLAVDKIQSRADFERAIELYLNKNFAEACVAFKKVLTQVPEDRTAELYLKKSAGYIVNGVPDDWTGADLV